MQAGKQLKRGCLYLSEAFISEGACEGWHDELAPRRRLVQEVQ